MHHHIQPHSITGWYHSNVRWRIRFINTTSSQQTSILNTGCVSLPGRVCLYLVLESRSHRCRTGRGICSTSALQSRLVGDSVVVGSQSQSPQPSSSFRFYVPTACEWGRLGIDENALLQRLLLVPVESISGVFELVDNHMVRRHSYWI